LFNVSCSAGAVQYQFSENHILVQDWSTKSFFLDAPSVTEECTVAARCSNDSACFDSNSVTVFVHSALGGATLSSLANGNLVVSNIGSSGNDGISLDLPDKVEQFDAAWADLDPSGNAPVGASFVKTVRGSINGVPNKIFSKTQAVKQASGNIGVTESFDDLGTTTVCFRTYNSGVLVDTRTRPAVNPGFYMSRAGGGSQFYTDVHEVILWTPSTGHLEYQDALTTGDPFNFDWIVLYPWETIQISHGNRVAASLDFSINPNPSDMVPSAIDFRLSQIPSMTIVSEAVTSVAAVPTVSEWGILALTLLLLVTAVVFVNHRSGWRGHA